MRGRGPARSGTRRERCGIAAAAGRYRDRPTRARRSRDGTAKRRRRRESKRNAGEDGDAETEGRNGERRGADADPRDVLRRPGHQCLRHRGGEQHSGDTAGDRQQHALDDQLAYSRQANNRAPLESQLSLAAPSAQHQAGDVDARDHEQQDDAKETRSISRCAAEHLLERRDTSGKPIRAGAPQLRLEAAGDGRRFGLGFANRQPGLSRPIELR